MKVSKVTGYLLLGMILAAGILFFVGDNALAEDVTITTYYPAPYGVYKEMRAKRMAIGDTYYDSSQYYWEDTTPNIDSAADLIVEGNVGIGTTGPNGRLDVVGSNQAIGAGWGNLIIRVSDAIAADIGGSIDFGGKYNGDAYTHWAGISGRKDNADDPDVAGYLALNTRASGEAMKERVRITSAGNVGIGTTSPGAPLQIGAGFTNLGGRLLTSNHADFGTNTDGQDPQLVLSYTSTSTDIGAGIGLALHNDAQTLNSYSPMIAFSRKSNSGSYNHAYAGIYGKVTGQGTDANWNAGQIHFFTTPVAGYGTTRMVIDTNGNVGIGTTDPGTRLQIDSGSATEESLVTFTKNAAAYTNGLTVGSAGATNDVFVGSAQHDGVIRADSGKLLLGSGSSNVDLAIDTNGNVGIGTTSPGAKLQVGSGAVGLSGQIVATDASGAYVVANMDTTTDITTFMGSDTSNYGMVGTYSNHDFVIRSNNTERIRVAAGGNVHILGTLSKGGGSFLIDHPLNPKNKILRHSFIEGPEPMLMYKGRAKLENGQAVIQLPDYFDALNHPEGREINLTCIGGWSPLYLDGEVSGNSFVVKTAAQGNSQQEFSWVVYAVRNDAFIQKNPIIVEEEKGVGNEFSKGEYIHPEAFGICMAKE